MAGLESEQQALVGEISGVFTHSGAWPTAQYVEKRLHRLGMSLDQIRENLPPGLLAPDLSARHVFLRDEDQLKLTVRGLAHADGADSAIDVFLRVIAYLGKREHEFMPASPTETERLSVTSAEIGTALKL